MKGSLFENFIISELIKDRFNRGLEHNVYFWRDSTGNEIDALLENGEKLFPVEIKSGKTITKDFFKGLQYWQQLTGNHEGAIVYAGDSSQKRSTGIEVRPWHSLPLKNVN